MRKAGILFPISSLPSRFGIGCFSKEAYDFVDFLEKAGQSVWQILPLGPTGFGDSPYQSTSAFAGNPYFIDPVTLIEEGLLTWDETNAFSFGGDPGKVDYGALYENRMKLLAIAAKRFFAEKNPEEQAPYRDFIRKQKYYDAEKGERPEELDRVGAGLSRARQRGAAPDGDPARRGARPVPVLPV